MTFSNSIEQADLMIDVTSEGGSDVFMRGRGTWPPLKTNIIGLLYCITMLKFDF